MAQSPQPEPLTFEQLHSYASALLDNASSLVADAQLLADAGRYARAYALSVLAFEEA